MATQQTPSNPPDPLALSSLDNPTPLAAQAIQANEIAITEFEDGTGLYIGGVLGGLPVAEKNQEYFLIVEEAGDTTPEIIGQTQFKISYLCDSLLNVSKPSGDGIALSNVLQNFERQKNVIVRVDQGTVLNNQLAGLQKITAIGSVEPIGGTQIGTGPLDYVTTMSFQLQDQLGASPGLSVASYYMWLNKSEGFQNMKLTFKTSGTLAFNGSAWSNTKASASSAETPLRAYFDYEQISSGSAVVKAVESVASPGANPPYLNGATADSDFYWNQINILTGSIEGNTRIKLKGAIGVNIVSSSVFDLFYSALYPEYLGGNKPNNYNFNKPITLNLYHESSTGNKTKIATTQKVVNTENTSLKNRNNSAGVDRFMEIFSTGTTTGIHNFSYSPNSVAYMNVESEFFSVAVGDKLYSEIVLPNEVDTNSFLSSSNYFDESLEIWKNDLSYRKYQYLGGHLIVQQETPEGSLFVNGVTGVTASYYTSQSSGFVSQSVFNNTGSYWIGYNNFTSTDDTTFGQPQSYITASTPLSLFYGDSYTQVNPGSEGYNVSNASTSVITSLGSGVDKKTWTRFGFNPINKKFLPQSGDFIRFEYSKSKVFQILQVQSTGNTLKLKLDGSIPLGTVVDNFLIYRIVEDGQFAILDVRKNTEAGVDQKFTGLISPQYPSTTLQSKSNTLIFELKQAGIIKD
jgi:hypothetical protein